MLFMRQDRRVCCRGNTGSQKQKVQQLSDEDGAVTDYLFSCGECRGQITCKCPAEMQEEQTRSAFNRHADVTLAALFCRKRGGMVSSHHYPLLRHCYNCIFIFCQFYDILKLQASLFLNNKWNLTSLPLENREKSPIKHEEN